MTLEGGSPHGAKPETHNSPTLSNLSDGVTVLTFIGVIFAPLFSSSVRTSLGLLSKVQGAATIALYLAGFIILAFGLFIWKTFQARKYLSVIYRCETELAKERSENELLLEKTKKKLEELANWEGEFALESFIQAYIDEIERDTQRIEKRCEYLAVEQEVRIDKYGNYFATYIHEAINTTGHALLRYTFDLRTTQRARFAELKTTATASFNGGPDVLARTESHHPLMGAETHIPVDVVLPRLVADKEHFKISLTFTWPQAIMSGRDGDSIHLGRFPEVKTFRFKISFEVPVFQGLWWWKNLRTGKPEPYPHQPLPSADGGYELKLSDDDKHFDRTIFLFIGHVEFLDPKQQITYGVNPNPVN